MLVVANAVECCRFFQTEDLGHVRNQLMSLQAKDFPEYAQLPSMAAIFLRTGDALYVPPGFIMLEKTVNDLGIAMRLLS